MATSAVVTMAVTAAGGAMAAASMSACFFHQEPGTLLEVTPDATVKKIGEARCRLRGGWRKVVRQVTHIGDFVVVSHKPGVAQDIVPLQGSQVSVEGDVVVVSRDGAKLAQFWPSGEQDEIHRWAIELDPTSGPKGNVPKMLSVTVDQMEKIRAEAMQWEERIKNARKGDPSSIAALEAEMNEREERIVTIEGEMHGYRTMPKMLSLNRKQIVELEASSKQKEAHVAQMQAQIDGMRDMPKMLSLNRRQLAELETQATEKEAEIFLFQKRLEELKDMPKRVALNRDTISSLQAETQEKEGMITALKLKLSQFQEMPKLLSLDRKHIAQLEAGRTPKDDKLAQLQEQLKTCEEMPKMLSLNRKQVAELLQKSNETELQLIELSREMQLERSKMRQCEQDGRLSSPPTNVTKEIVEGPATVAAADKGDSVTLTDAPPQLVGA